MKTRYLIITALICVISIIGCIIASAANTGNTPENITDVPKIDTTIDDNNIAKNDVKKMTHTLFDGTEIELTFEEIPSVINGTRFDYTDGKGYTYRFDQYDRLTGYFTPEFHDFKFYNDPYMSDSIYLPDSAWISEEEVIKISEAHTDVFYGNEFDKLSLVRVKKDELVGRYAVYYELRYSPHPDIDILAAWANVTVDYEGNLLSSTTWKLDIVSEFDASRLDGITLEELEEFSEECAKKLYLNNQHDKYTGSELGSIQLVKDGNNYALELNTKIDLYITDLFIDGGTSENFYFPIP